MTSENSFGARSTLEVDGASYEVFRLDAVEGAADLPYSLKVLLENLLRTEDGANTTVDSIRAIAQWDPTAEPDTEIQYTPARVLMQDFTGVPCVVDLATMREAMADLGGDPKRINPLAPAELVIDHSVIADHFGSKDALGLNSALEYERNRERYEFLKWGQTAFEDFKVVPPETGIVHQVNLERLATVVFTRDAQTGVVSAYPDTLVGTDSHTTMINGLGVLGWGVGGIEAEAAMLGQPVSMLIPKVVGFKLTGELPAGATATDLVLTVTELLRKQGVVGKFVEFYGPGVANVPLADRATIGNMSPEYGSTCAIFPIDDETLSYLRLTGRPAETVALVEAYAKTQGMWHDPSAEPRFSERVELDLVDRRAVARRPEAPAGPRAADRRQGDVPHRARRLRHDDPRRAGPQARRPAGGDRGRASTDLDEASAESFPASDPIAPGTRTPDDEPAAHNGAGDAAHDRPSNPVPVTLASGDSVTIDHGHVAIAAITSCTNTSNPYVMVGAGLLAKNAVEKGLTSKPWVKTTLAPGSKVVTDYYEKAGLTPYLDKLGFQTVGYGCTTCIGNSGPLPSEVVRGGGRGRPRGGVGAVGQPQLRGAHQPRHQDELPGVPAAGRGVRPGRLDGRRHHDRAARAPAPTASRSSCATSGRRRRTSPPSSARRSRATCTPRRTPTSSPAPSAGRRSRCPPARPSPGTPSRPTSASPRTSTACSASRSRSPTSPARRCSPSSATRSRPTTSAPPAASASTRRPGRTCRSTASTPKDFNSYGSRRGNHEVMIRGTFANIRLRNQLAPGHRGRVHGQGRRADVDLRGVAGLPGRGHAAGDPRRQGVRLGLLARLGRQGHRAARRARRDRRVVRAHPPLEPHRDGRAAAAVRRRARTPSRSA